VLNVHQSPVPNFYRCFGIQAIPFHRSPSRSLGSLRCFRIQTPPHFRV
jgi:hypothetical protein